MKIEKKIQKSYSELKIPPADKVLPEGIADNINTYNKKSNSKRMMVYLLSAAVLVTLLLSITAGALISQGSKIPEPSPVGTTEMQTTVSSESNNTSDIPSLFPPLWISIPAAPYAIIRISEKEDETEFLPALRGVGYTEYDIYKVEVVFTISDQVKSWNIDTFYVTVDSCGLKPGDILLAEVNNQNVNDTIYYYPLEYEQRSKYIVFSDEKTINADDALSSGALSKLAFNNANHVIDEEKRFQGEMTLEDVINFFKAIEEAYEKWQDWYNSLDFRTCI